MSTNLSTLEILGIRLKGYSKETLLALLGTRIQRQQRTLVLSGNIHAFNLAYEQPWLLDLFNRADFIRVDGAGLRLGARLLGQMLPPRMTWADFIWDLAALAELNRYRLFFLGGRPEVAATAATILQKKHPDLPIVGCHHGYFNKTGQHPENEVALGIIQAARPDILIIGMGVPIQEQWISDNWEQLHATVIMTAGAVFDYVSGRLQRPAPIFTRTGFEWLGRLLIEPQRLWRRYLIGNPRFFWRILKQRFNLW